MGPPLPYLRVNALSLNRMSIPSCLYLGGVIPIEDTLSEQRWHHGESDTPYRTLGVGVVWRLTREEAAGYFFSISGCVFHTR